MSYYKQPWIGKPLTDIVFIILPPFLCLLTISLFPSLFQSDKNMPDAWWVILILLIDVAHVYSTLYRTYFDPVALKGQRSLLVSIPLLSLIVGILIYSLSSILFWRILAYVAIFHFVRQQYGFMRVYSRKEQYGRVYALIDKVAVYYATLYPLLYWHLTGPKNFDWFIENDILYFNSPRVLFFFTVLYAIVVFVYIVKEVAVFIRFKMINVPRFLVIAGTFLSWYFGIVYFNGDMAFTLLNVVSHGIPYMALVWLYGRKNYGVHKRGSAFLRKVFSKYGVVIFLALLFLFAFIEEGLWDITVWKEHQQVFGGMNGQSISIPDKLLAFIVPILALPQITHYILDGFIWKIREDNFKWNSEVKNLSK